MQLIHTRWDTHQDAIRLIRQRVYIEEQQIAADEEWDDHHHPDAKWVLAMDGHQPAGCARLLRNGYFGRLAVLPEYRGTGLGKQLVSAMIEMARQQGFPQLDANAQCHALPFYWSLGFVSHGPIFDDAGIPHIAIRHPLQQPDTLPTAPALQQGRDQQRWSLPSELSQRGFLISLLAQVPTRLTVTLANPEDRRWHHQQLLDGLLKAVKSSPRTRVRLLLRHDDGIQDLPLFQMSLRLTSRFDIRINSEISDNIWLFDRHGLLENGQGCAADAHRCSHLFEYANRLYQTSRTSSNLRQWLI